MGKFQAYDLVRYKGRLYTIERTDEEGNCYIVPRHISDKEDDSPEAIKEYFQSMIRVPQTELTNP